MSNQLIEVQKFGQSIWYDNIRRGMITDGTLQAMVDQDRLLGVTSNPAIFEKAINESADYDPALRAYARQGVQAPIDLYEKVAIEDIQLAADILHPVYHATSRRDGFVSFEVSPYLAADTEQTIDYARRVYALLGRDNVMIKVPGTPEGMPAIAALIGEGINVNVTLLFSVAAYEACAAAYMEGLEAWVDKGGDPGRVASVASFFISRIDNLVDEKLQEAAEDQDKHDACTGLLGEIAVANAILAYDRYHALVATDRWQALARKGAAPQRLLWASTSTKNKAYSPTKYIDELIGEDTVNTVPDATFRAYRDTGRPSPALQDGWAGKLETAQAQMATLAAAGISLDDCTARLLEDGVKQFSDAFGVLLESIEKKREVLKDD
jgi:transaldolase/glucose-6-phosphate isomerase